MHCKTLGVNITLLGSKYYPCKRNNLFWGKNYSRNKGHLYAGVEYRGEIRCGVNFTLFGINFTPVTGVGNLVVIWK